MVSFKSNNVSSEQSPPHRHLPGTLRGTLSHSHNHHHHHHNHPHRHEQQPPPPPPPSTYRTPPPPPPASSYITVQRGCALHSRLDQPVTNSTPGMDNKKVVQSPTPPVPVQVRSKHDGSGVAASVSGVRRRSGPQGLRSPAAKRPLSAPVALQGWLHKQGSEGLMLWKKRWFVLSEYCLFYYKGPEEEKLLGSILLPSYRVTVCKPEDKVNKKFAFKAEHANMRTYHFAADSRESMNQWVNALTLATLLQDPSPGMGEAAVVIEIAGQQDGERSARPSVSSISSILNQSADDSDSGFHGFQSRDDPSHASNNNSSPNSANTASFPNLSGSNSNGNSAGNNHTSEPSHPMMNGWIQQSPQYGQPGTSQPPPSQQHQQYGHLLPSQQLQPGHSHQHQALLHQHLPHQNALPSAHQASHPHKHVVQQPPQQQQQQQQSQHVGTAGVQTVQPMSRKFGQPIYANAPPKPRRLTDGSNEYSTPSPDPDYRKSPVSPDVTVTSKSPMSDYESGRNAIYGARINQTSQQSLRTDKSGLNYGYGQTQSTERRTPDTYGRSAKPRSGRGNGDYEEVYGTPQLYQRPAGPVGYTKGASPAPIPIPLYAQHQHLQQQLHSPITPPNISMVRQSRAQPPPRPHSADFLEYESTRRPQQQPAQCEKPPNQQRRPQRPKSSLDIVNPSDTTNDGYFYSEERYAAQMRQSAVYLHQTPQHYQQQRNQSLSRVTMQPKLPGIRDKPDESRVSTLPDSSCPALRRSQRDHVHQQHTMPTQSLTQRHSEMIGADPKLRRSLREKSCEANGRETLTHGEDNTVPRRVLSREYDGWGRTASHGGHGTHISQTCHAGYAGGGRRWGEQQQFCRSASARLPRTRHPAALDPDDDDYAERSSEQDSRDGERKIQQREESMKRLLEWKQRMLQSPLTRKPSGSANRGRAQNDLSSYYKQQALLDLAAHEAAVAEGRHSRRREDGHRSHVRSKSSDGRRSAGNVPRYNSYSSDDEASGSGSVIGRDPLPPRAVSTSHLPQRTLTQPPTVVSTLPLPRSSTSSHRQQPLPLHHSTPQHQSLRQLEDEPANSQMLRAASNGDIGRGPGMVTSNEMKDLRLASPGGHSTHRLISPVGHLRVASLNDHRVSSPSDSEIRVHSPSERKMISPIGREVDRGGGAATGQRPGQPQQRARDCSELLHKRSNISSQRADAGGRVTQAGASGLVRVSAGELLGRTHEELVLLLIQLRRQNATVLKAMETCHMEIEAQARLVELDTPRRLENLQKLEELKRHLMDLEKQYEKSKPLVNLVDNMVKLGSLYNRNTANGTSNVSGSRHDLMHENARDHRDRLEFNQRVQEQRLLAEERRDWDRLSPDHGQLQAKVQQLYKLDRLLQEESGTLHSLQQDKEILEKALGGLRHKLQGSRSNLAEAERYRKQQLLLERELSRVRVLLAHNSKKLEETVAENARLEQDLVVLRQKLQASRRYAGNIARDTSSTTAPLEAELRRVQQLVGDLQRQRKELSIQVRQLTEKSHSLVQQIRPQPAHAPQVHHPKKRTQNSWLETDLDSGITLDHGLDSSSSPPLSASPPSKHNDSPHQRYGSPTQYKDTSPLNRPSNQQPYAQPSQNHISALSPQLREQIQQHQLKQQLLKDQMQGKGSTIQVAPLYVNTDSRVPGDYIADTSKHNGSVPNGAPNPAPEYIPPPPPPLSEEALLLNENYRQNEDNKFAGLMHNREKQEIKTVRIVKRESERRQRDRGDRTGNIGIPLTNGLQAPGGAKRLCDDDLGGSQKFEKAQLGRVVEESPIVHAQSTVQLSELDDVQFQRSMSLPRGFGGQKQHSGVHCGPVVPPPRSDSMHALRSMMARRHKIRFESHDGSSDSTLSPYTDSTTSSSHMPMSSPNYSTTSSYSPSQNPNYLPQTIATQSHHYYNPPGPYRHYDGAASSIRTAGTLAGTMSPELTSPTNVGVHEKPATVAAAASSAPSTKTSSESPQLSPVFKSEAAKQIIKEMTEKRVEGPRRRQIPREKRRHYTVSSSKPVLDLEDTFSKMGMGRARDDLDMERALRPRINAPDVVRSTLSHKELKYNESTIDQLLGTPNKIVIPERYIPEQTPELTAEEQEQRLKKAEAIRKMLSETTVTAPEGGDEESNVEKSDTLKRKVVEEKRQREHILQLNQILAKQVMEKSKMVAVKALATLPLKTESSLDDEDLSPVAPLPLYQQRENYYS